MSARVVIAARGGPDAKSRCAGVLRPDQRDGLTAAMLADMLETIIGIRGIAAVYVTTPTPELMRLARELGAQTMEEPEETDLNSAFEAAVGRIAAETPDDVVVLLVGDLPALEAKELEGLIGAHRAGGVVLVPAEADGGTSAVVMNVRDRFRPAFGAASFERHLETARACGLTAGVVRAPSLAFDVDRPADLDRVRRLIPASRTARLLDAAQSATETAA